MIYRLGISWLAAWIVGASAWAAPASDFSAAPRRLVIAAESAVIPLDFSGGRPVVEVSIEGAGPFRMVLDTGGVGLMIDGDLADDLDLPIVGVSQVSSPMGDSEGIPVKQARIESMKLGDVTLEHLLVDLWESEPIFTGDNAPRGIFGITLLRDALPTLDLSSERLELAFGELPETGADIVGLELDQGLPVLNIDVAGRLVPAHLDSGNPGSLLLPFTLSSELPLGSPLLLAGRARTVDAVVEIYRAVIDGPIDLAGHRHEDLEVHFIKGTPWANVGVSLLERFVVTLDLRNQRARFQRSPNEP